MGKKWIAILLILALLALVLFFVLRAVGIISFDLYQSEASTERSATFISSVPTGPGPAFSYDMTLSYDGEPISFAQGLAADKPVLDIDVNVLPTFSGSYKTPLYKSFTVEFSAPFESSTPDGMYSVQGDVSGVTQMKIIGLCTSRKAQELARDEIVSNVEEYLKEQLASQGE